MLHGSLMYGIKSKLLSVLFSGLLNHRPSFFPRVIPRVRIKPSVTNRFQCPVTCRGYLYHYSSLNQCRMMWTTKATQNTTEPRTTGILTHNEEAKASRTNKCQSANHRVLKADPTVAPTRIWFSVWRRCDTRSHDCMHIRRLD